MASDPTQRRLAAILHADVVGYSRLMAEDEAATIRTLESYRTEVTNLVSDHRGRVADFTGDDFLAEFPTALEAVEAAVEIQRARTGSVSRSRTWGSRRSRTFPGPCECMPWSWEQQPRGSLLVPDAERHRELRRLR